MGIGVAFKLHPHRTFKGRESFLDEGRSAASAGLGRGIRGVGKLVSGGAVFD